MAEFITYGQQSYLKKVLEAIAHKQKCKSDEAAKTIRCPLPIDNLTKEQASKFIGRGLDELSGRRANPRITDNPNYSIGDYWRSVKGRR